MYVSGITVQISFTTDDFDTSLSLSYLVLPMKNFIMIDSIQSVADQCLIINERFVFRAYYMCDQLPVDTHKLVCKGFNNLL
jgi:hypothetical protein